MFRTGFSLFLIPMALIGYAAISGAAFGVESGYRTSQAVAALGARADAGEPDAQYQLGLLGISGALGEQGRARAVDLLAAAANGGHNGACFVLGSLYLRGAIVGRNTLAAAQLFRAAAERGDARSQNALALLLLGGDGIAKDQAEAQKLLELAAAEGLVEAKSNLGVLLVQNSASPENVARGVALLRLVAEEKPAADSYFNYGWLFDTGTGVAADPAEAGKWYRQAADLGSSRAQYNLAMLSLRAGDRVGAMEWLMIVAASIDAGFKNKAATAIPELAGKMTPEEVGRAGDAANKRLLLYAARKTTAAR